MLAKRNLNPGEHADRPGAPAIYKEPGEVEEAWCAADIDCLPPSECTKLREVRENAELTLDSAGVVAEAASDRSRSWRGEAAVIDSSQLADTIDGATILLYARTALPDV